MITSVAYSPDGKTVITGSGDSTIRLCDISTGEQLHILLGHTECVSCVAFSPDGKSIFTGVDRGIALLWNREDYCLITSIDKEDSSDSESTELRIEEDTSTKNSADSKVTGNVIEVSKDHKVLGFTQAINLDDDSQKECCLQ